MSSPAPRQFSPYDNNTHMRRQVDEGHHRAVIGGMWHELGSHQLAFLTDAGLKPHHRFIDVGAGSFRAGIKLVPYLSPGNYYAIDIQDCLLEAGYEREIAPAGLAERFPRSNFTATDCFDLSSFDVMFDFGIAQSVFTHMPIERLHVCLSAITPYFRAGGIFFVTVFLVKEEEAGNPVRHAPGGVTTTAHQDPFHTTRGTLDRIFGANPDWQMTVIGDWSHPRNQNMLQFTRVGSPKPSGSQPQDPSGASRTGSNRGTSQTA